MSEMIERVAEALFEHRMKGDDFTRELVCGNPPVPYRELIPSYKALFEADARAMIAAMREPTEAMLVLTQPRHLARVNWTVMIDEALKG